MSDITVARRYAQALYEEAVLNKRTDKVDEDVELIRASLDGSRELVRFFESPVVSREKKEAVVTSLFGRRVQPSTLQFLKLLIEKKRETIFPVIVQAYRALRDRQLGILEVKARAPYPLSEQEEKHLAQALERITGQHIRLHVQLEAALIGGLVVRVGDTVYDGSVRHQLATLREQLGLGRIAMN